MKNGTLLRTPIFTEEDLAERVALIRAEYEFSRRELLHAIASCQDRRAAEVLNIASQRV